MGFFELLNAVVIDRVILVTPCYMICFYRTAEGSIDAAEFYELIDRVIYFFN